MLSDFLEKFKISTNDSIAFEIFYMAMNGEIFPLKCVSNGVDKI